MFEIDADEPTETPEADGKCRLLYFEDDAQVATMTQHFLSSRGFEVLHHTEFTEDLSCEGEVLAVLMDINLPGTNGYQACEKLLAGILPETTPVIFTSGLMADEDIEKAYAVGADDYLVKPVKLKELATKLERYKGLAEQRLAIQKQLEETRNMAFDAMTASSELGQILRFHESAATINNVTDLGQELIQAIAQFGVRSSVLFFGSTDPVGAATDQSAASHCYCSEDGLPHPLEMEVLKKFHGKERIYSWKQRTFFNYPSFSVLIKNMPVGDELRYGILKDQLCLLLNGVEARVQSIGVEQSNRRMAQDIKTVAEAIGNIVMEMEAENANVSQDFQAIMVDMEANLHSELVQFNLLEKEERALLEYVKKSIKETSAIVERTATQEEHYREVMSELLKQLAKAARQPC